MAERSETKWERWFKYFQYEEGKDSPSDARNVLLIVAALIAAVTFQAGINPPGGVWQDDEKGHKAGRAVYSDQTIEFRIFLIFNTMALSTSLLLIIFLTSKFPFRLEIVLAILSMGVTYVSAIFAVMPDDLVKLWHILAAAAAASLLMRGFGQTLHNMKGKDLTIERPSGIE